MLFKHTPPPRAETQPNTNGRDSHVMPRPPVPCALAALKSYLENRLSEQRLAGHMTQGVTQSRGTKPCQKDVPTVPPPRPPHPHTLASLGGAYGEVTEGDGQHRDMSQESMSRSGCIVCTASRLISASPSLYTFQHRKAYFLSVGNGWHL